MLENEVIKRVEADLRCYKEIRRLYMERGHKY
jgi:hypothetical protein